MTNGNSGSSGNFNTALTTFELENQVYHWDESSVEELVGQKPWKQDHNWFNKVRISAVALIKMVMHARSGGDLEVMGLMQGKPLADGSFLILDAFPLPVEGTETRVNAGDSANEFMCTYVDSVERVNKKEFVVGWYHSHPGYRPWLSGIDVQTQRTYQAHQEPFLAVVIDPHRTCAAGKVDIGAFRTYPADYKPAQTSAASRASIPMERIEDFGVHANSYYSLPIEYFKSKRDTAPLELLWERYWTDTLSRNPLLGNRKQITKSVRDCVSKLEVAAKSFTGQSAQVSEVAKVATDAGVTSVEIMQGLSTQVGQLMLFHRKGCGCKKEHRINLGALDRAAGGAGKVG